jgi:hypothetical protein
MANIRKIFENGKLRTANAGDTCALAISGERQRAATWSAASGVSNEQRECGYAAWGGGSPPVLRSKTD